MKIGGELFLHQHYTNNCTQCMGIIDAGGGPAPANIESLLPDAFNADTWNLAAMSPLVRRYTLGVLKSRRDLSGFRGTRPGCRTTGTSPTD